MKKTALLLPLFVLSLLWFTAAAAGEVARAQFTTGISVHEPIDAITELGTDQTQVYFFTELTGFSGETITHRWEHGGEMMAEVSFDVRGPRWRVWSSKQLQPGWTGEWKVSVVDGAGNVLVEKTFNYGPAAEPAMKPAMEPGMEPASDSAMEPAPETKESQ
jgi:hypothetical protein